MFTWLMFVLCQFQMSDLHLGSALFASNNIFPQYGSPLPGIPNNYIALVDVPLNVATGFNPAYMPDDTDRTFITKNGSFFGILSKTGD